MRLDIQRTVAIESEKKRVDVGAPISIIVNRKKIAVLSPAGAKSYNNE